MVDKTIGDGEKRASTEVTEPTPIPETPISVSNCTTKLKNAKNNKKVQKLVKSMEEKGCNLPESFFTCTALCPTKDSLGGFKPAELGGPGVVLCADLLEEYKVPQKMVTELLVHELVHAYDSCRAKVDWGNCHHIACSEVRAANLSGDCRLINEINRGNFGFQGIGEKCIRRRAQMSVAGHDQCTEKAKLYVEQVFPKCIEDIAPFMNR